VNRSSGPLWAGIVLVCVGLFGAAFAITGMVTGLPVPAAGGTCGPGKGSEAAIVALFDPITIGAGPEPPATDATDRAEWSEFVHDCQTEADDRAFAVFPILIASVAVAVIGPLVVWRRSRRQARPAPVGVASVWPPPPWSALDTGHDAAPGPTSGAAIVSHLGPGLPSSPPPPQPPPPRPPDRPETEVP
jgi:hypothetical protein